MKLIDLGCNYCGISFQRTRKAYNRSQKLGGDSYKPFCSATCNAQYRSIHSLSREGLPPNKKRCTKCLDEKFIADFSKGSPWCKLCASSYQEEYRNQNPLTDEQKLETSKRAKNWREQNKEYLKQQSKNYYETNKDKLKVVRENYYKENKDKIRAKGNLYYKNNREKVITQQKEYQSLNKDKVRASKVRSERKRMANDPSFKLRKRISGQIRDHMKRFGSSKNGKSILNFLPYTIEELRIHLENQFEPWMNWNNYRAYNSKTWNDDDQSIWTWSIDHIVPQYKLPYQSMDEDNFKKCWSLNNLRPMSSKQNLLDGVNKVR
jgi:hypothetical protein